MTAERHPGLFVGAGPGDPELITVKGQKALQRADIVVYAGSIVPEAALQWTGAGAQLVNSASLNLEEIVDRMVAAWSEGKRVVRLHSGDPSLYGAIFEQMAALDEKGATYKSVPGVTAAFAAAAAMGIEYTLPEISQTLILTRMAGRTPVPDGESLASLAAHQASMAIYLSIAHVKALEKILITSYGEKSRCAVAHRVSQPEERIIFTTLDRLSETVEKENITHQALVIVGRVLNVEKSELKHKSKLYDREFSHQYRNTS